MPHPGVFPRSRSDGLIRQVLSVLSVLLIMAAAGTWYSLQQDAGTGQGMYHSGTNSIRMRTLDPRTRKGLPLSRLAGINNPGQQDQDNKTMKVLITGAAGNLGSRLARHMLSGDHHLVLMIHRTPLPSDLVDHGNVTVARADLADRTSLAAACAGVDCIVHFAGVLFEPGPEKFLPVTNVDYVQHLTSAAVSAGVRRFILVSFPHVEGISTPDAPAMGRVDGNPESAHARTRLKAENVVRAACQGSAMEDVVLRAGMIYAKGVLMIDAARWLARRRLLGVWTRPTWIHLLALPDFNRAVVAAIENPTARGIYNLGDEGPMTLQDFLDQATAWWGLASPWRMPEWMIFGAAGACEVFARLFGTKSPLTRDFIRIGMASYYGDTSRSRTDLIAELEYPTLRTGINLL